MATENPPQKLPVIGTALQAINLPLIHWQEFFRFGYITLGMMFLRSLIWPLATPNNPQINPIRLILGILLLLAASVVIIPYHVAWVRLTVNGPGSVANRPVWTFGRVELRFAVGLLALGVVAGGPFGITLACALLARNIIALMVFLLIVAASLFIVGIGCSVRLWFALIELALQRYKGPLASWRQTQGSVWRLIGLGFLLPLPFMIGSAICTAIQTMVMTFVGWAVFALLASTLTVLAGISVVGGIALAYKLTASAPETTAAIAAS